MRLSTLTIQKHRVAWIQGISMWAPILFTACGGGSQRADIHPGRMPSGGTFTGVWFSPQYGEMHMRQSGAMVIAEYTKDERRGRIQGTVHGNALRFQWEEKRELLSGRPTVTHGRGYFQYVIGQDEKHYVLGEWGHDNSEIGGGPWRAYKLRNRMPELSTDTRSSARPGHSAIPEEPREEEQAPRNHGGEDDLEGLEGQ